jgi:hypothetical protein
MFRVKGLMVQDVQCGAYDLGRRIQGLGLREYGLGCRA